MESYVRLLSGAGNPRDLQPAIDGACRAPVRMLVFFVSIGYGPSPLLGCEEVDAGAMFN